jgi:1-acyl-sn-glycerol-3-phosphate acyltransferase
MIALHAQVPIVPSFYQGPKFMQFAHLTHRPSIRIVFGTPIPTAGLPIDKDSSLALTQQIEIAIDELRARSVAL